MESIRKQSRRKLEIERKDGFKRAQYSHVNTQWYSSSTLNSVTITYFPTLWLLLPPPPLPLAVAFLSESNHSISQTKTHLSSPSSYFPLLL